MAGDHASRVETPPSLSKRETQVLELAARGMTNEAVARALDVSVHAIKFHLSSIYRKLDVSNRTEAAVAFLREDARSSVGSDH